MPNDQEAGLGSTDHHRISFSVKALYTLFVAVLVPCYWSFYGPANFLWLCDLALLLTVVLRQLGLKVSQLNILVVTAKLGLAQPAKVCDILHLDTSTLSRNVDRMRAKGWLEVVPGEDTRTQPFRLTAQGRRLLERAVPAWEQAQQQAGELLDDEGIA